MASALFAGIGVAGVAMGAKYALRAAEHISANPAYMKQAGAAAAGFKGMGNAFKMPAALQGFFKGGSGAGFEATMSRREAAQILCCKETAPKKDIKVRRRERSARGRPRRCERPADRRLSAAAALGSPRRSPRNAAPHRPPTARSCCSTTPTAAARPSSRPRSTRRARCSPGR